MVRLITLLTRIGTWSIIVVSSNQDENGRICEGRNTNEGRKAAVRPTEGRLGANEGQITTTKGNRRGHDTTTNTGGRVVLKKTRLC